MELTTPITFQFKYSRIILKNKKFFFRLSALINKLLPLAFVTQISLMLKHIDDRRDTKISHQFCGNEKLYTNPPIYKWSSGGFSFQPQ